MVSIWISHNSRKQYTRYRICNMLCDIRALSLMTYAEHMYIHMLIHTHVFFFNLTEIFLEWRIINFFNLCLQFPTIRHL